ncbi:hypothetical protein ACTHGU_01775 [Chitinophagaceae bacterium MMS25-I14]
MGSLLKIVQGLPDYEFVQYPSGAIHRGSFRTDTGYYGMLVLGNVVQQCSLISAAIPAIESGSYLFFVPTDSEEVLILQDEIGTRLKPGEHMPQGWDTLYDIGIVLDKKGWSCVLCLYLPDEYADLKLKDPMFLNNINKQLKKILKQHIIQ